MSEVKKKIRPGAVELHSEDAALVVHYEVQEVGFKEDGEQEVISSSHATKKITVKSLNERTDLQALAAEVVDKCKLIHPSKVSFVCQLLQQLQQRLQQQTHSHTHDSNLSSTTAVRQHTSPLAATSTEPCTTGSPARPSSSSSLSVASTSSPRPHSTAELPRPESARSRPASASRSNQQVHASSSASYHTRLGRQQQRSAGRAGHEDEAAAARQQEQLQQRAVVQASDIFEGLLSGHGQKPAFMEELEVYIEGLYAEDLLERAAAANMICQLFRNTNNLQVLLERENLLSTLARLLREDGMKSLDLATAIAGCFFACSCLQQLHSFLLENQVGSVLMDLTSLELLQRSTAREAQEGPGSSAAAIAARAAAAKAGAAPALGERECRLGSLVVRQDRFLYIVTATLLHLAEDTAVQKKMWKKDMVGLLVAMLSRPHVELLLLAVGFLRRLCVYQENKDRLATLPNVIPQLLSLIQPGCGDHLQSSVLRLLHNLSFDAGLRQQMIQGGLVPQAVLLLDHPQAAPLAAGLLYQLSMDDNAKGLFVFCPGALQRLYESIMRAMGASGPAAAGSGTGGFAGFQSALTAAAAGGGSSSDLRSIPELIALAVNLAHNKRTAEWFAGGEKLERLLKRSLTTGDELAWKLLHNLAASGGAEVAGRMLVHARGMLAMLQSPKTGPELFTEVLGTLAAACDAMPTSSSSSSSNSNNNTGDSDSGGCSIDQFVPAEEVVTLLQACLEPGSLDDDALLNAVILIGTLAGRPEYDAILTDSGLILRLVDLIAAKRVDDEFVLQICWAFSRCLMQPASSQALLGHQHVVPYLVDLLQDDCFAVRRVAGRCLDVIADVDDATAAAIRSLKFEAHNQDWLRLAGPDAQAVMMMAPAVVPIWQQPTQFVNSVGMRTMNTSADARSLDDAYASSNPASGSQQQGAQYPTQYQQLLQPAAGCGQQQQLQGPQWQAALQMQAGGQQMVLDLDEYVAGMDESASGMTSTDSRLVAAA